MPTINFKNKKLVIFDFDGLLVNSEDVIKEAWKKTCKYFGIETPTDFFDHINGISKDVTILKLEKIAGKQINQEEFFHQRSIFIDESVENKEIHLLPGVRQMMEYIFNLGILMRICTSSSRQWPLRLIKQLKIEKYIKAVLGYEDVENVKPFPDIYKKTLLEENLAPTEAIIFEDSVPGINAAESAGVFVVAVNSEEYFRNKIKKETNPNMIVSSFEDLI
ncbi:HAD family hydrolase [Eremococcus coleocola]|uniref:HAD family hydrolase n=1 Tax=Eremococcus coleocola TaxID=88132 RepID=UPI000421CCD2|nr:HAD family phosphatase [Eremococcus coleocola]